MGKTLITAALAHQLQAQGHRVRALKPVISGYSAETAKDSDTAVLLRSTGRPMTDETVAETSPWRFAAAIAPDMAARREGRSLSLEEIIAFCRNAPKGSEDVLLIEGVGGAMVPLDERHTVMDWMACLGAPALIVTGSYLGTISHTLTTVEAMRARDVPPAAVIVSESEDAPVSLDETAEAISRFIPDLPIVTVARIGRQKAPWTAVSDLTHLLLAVPSD